MPNTSGANPSHSFMGFPYLTLQKQSYMPVLRRLRIYCQMEVCKKKIPSIYYVLLSRIILENIEDKRTDS